MVEKLKCYLGCKDKIVPSKEKFVTLQTTDFTNEKFDVQYFHWDCWVRFFNNKVHARAEAIVKNMQDEAIKIYQNSLIKEVLEKIDTSKLLGSMLTVDLDKYKGKNGKQRTKKARR